MFEGALYGGVMLASAMTIKTPPPGYKVPGSGSGSEAARGPVASAATAVQVGKHVKNCHY